MDEGEGVKISLHVYAFLILASATLVNWLFSNGYPKFGFLQPKNKSNQNESHFDHTSGVDTGLNII